MQLPAKQTRPAAQLAMHFPAEKRPGLQHIRSSMYANVKWDTQTLCHTTGFFRHPFLFFLSLFVTHVSPVCYALNRSLWRRTSLFRRLFSRSLSISLFRRVAKVSIGVFVEPQTLLIAVGALTKGVQVHAPLEIFENLASQKPHFLHFETHFRQITNHGCVSFIYSLRNPTQFIHTLNICESTSTKLVCVACYLTVGGVGVHNPHSQRKKTL